LIGEDLFALRLEILRGGGQRDQQSENRHGKRSSEHQILQQPA
jgi:hypothetical protein